MQKSPTAVPKARRDNLLRAIRSMTTDAELARLLEDLCTPAELHALADRWEVMQRLEAGQPQRDIAAATGVSIGTVTRGSKLLGNNKGGVTLALKRLDNPFAGSGKKK